MNRQVHRLILLVSLTIISVVPAACSREQLKRSTYDALHKREQLKCQEEGRRDCPEYESYPEYRKKLEETPQ